MPRRIVALVCLIALVAMSASAAASGDTVITITLCPAKITVAPGGLVQIKQTYANPGVRPVTVQPAMRLVATGTGPAMTPQSAGWRFSQPPGTLAIPAGGTKDVTGYARAPATFNASTPREWAAIASPVGASPAPGSNARAATLVILSTASSANTTSDAAGGCATGSYVVAMTATSTAPATSATPSPAAAPQTLAPVPANAMSFAPPATPPAQLAPHRNVSGSATPPNAPFAVSPALYAAGATATVAAIGAGTLAFRHPTRRARLAGLLAPALGLFTRLTRPKVLDSAMRERILALVRERPGIHYEALKTALRANNGTLTHHVRILEAHALLASRREGRFRRYYPVDARLPPITPTLNATAQTILEALEGGDVPFAELAQRLNVSKQRLSYNVKLLDALGEARLVERESDGRWVVHRIPRAPPTRGTSQASPAAP